jgi:hypothetical protein
MSLSIRLTEIRARSIFLYHMFIGNLERAILEALAYSDIFEYPLRLDELHHYLPVLVNADELPATLRALNGQVGKRDDFYFLAERQELVEIRQRRAERSYKLLPKAIQYGRVLGSLPFVRMVALTGSLAVMNVTDGADIDYMLVTQAGRLWTARAFAVTFGRMMRLSGHTICVNVLVSENALPWPRHDLYSAREMGQMIPITGTKMYDRLRMANTWTQAMLPNCGRSAPGFARFPEQKQGWSNQIQRLWELPLRGALGQRIEQSAMKFQLRRIGRRSGMSDETNFSADLCQANFHHHRKSVWDAFQHRLNHLEVNKFHPFSPKEEPAESTVKPGAGLKVS